MSAAHRQCARDANTLSSDVGPEDGMTHPLYVLLETNPYIIEAKQWRCSACIQNGMHHDDEDDEKEEKGKSSEKITPRRRLSSVPKLARDLLPSVRGVDPSSHSIFKNLILPDDAPEGTRSLRKRKSSHEEEAPNPVPARQSRKKRRPSEVSKSEAAPSIAPSSPQPSVKNTPTDGDTDGDGADEAEADSGSDQEESRPLSSRARRSAKPQRKNKTPLVLIY